jgi:nucleotide-binding universal stress UspA family protein
MYRRIIVTLDGSELSERALPEAERLARVTGSPIHLLQVVDPTQIPWYGQYGMAMEFAAVEESLGAERTRAEEHLAEIVSGLEKRGVHADIEVRRGSAAKEIAEAAQPGDLLVMASHGRSGLSRWFLGSVAEAVLRHATVPILLIKAPVEAIAESKAPAPVPAAAPA